MRLLADTNLFVWFTLREPMPAIAEAAFADANTERFLSPASVVEIYRHFQRGVIKEDPDNWLPLALPQWTILPVTVPIARQSVLFDWAHRDPGDRLLAATAKVEGVELWHTDTILKQLKDFPGRYFKPPAK